MALIAGGAFPSPGLNSTVSSPSATLTVNSFIDLQAKWQEVFGEATRAGALSLPPGLAPCGRCRLQRALPLSAIDFAPAGQ